MVQKHFLIITSFVFFLIGLLHLLRLLLGWEAVIGGWQVPAWLSVVALVIAWLLAGWGMRLAKR